MKLADKIVSVLGLDDPVTASVYAVAALLQSAAALLSLAL